METPPNPPTGVRRVGIVLGRHTKEKRDFTRHLRQNMTPAETALWKRLRGGRFHDLHFRRQQIIDGFIVDFFCYTISLIIEIDGPIHDGQRTEDEARETALRKRNLTILRFTNNQILYEMSSVLQRIQETAHPTQQTQPKA